MIILITKLLCVINIICCHLIAIVLEGLSVVEVSVAVVCVLSPASLVDSDYCLRSSLPYYW